MITGFLYAQGCPDKPLLAVQAEDINAALQTIMGNREFTGLEVEYEALGEVEAFVHVKLPFGHRFTYIFIGTRD